MVHLKKRQRDDKYYPNPPAKFRLKLEKVGTTTRPFSYDLSQIPYNHTGEVTNRFKGLDLIDRVERLLLNHDAGILGPRRRRIQSGARDEA